MLYSRVSDGGRRWYVFFSLWTVLFLLTCLAGCSRPDIRMLWPAPPLTPRFEHIGLYRSELDLQKKGARFPQLPKAVSEKSLLIAPYGIAVDAAGRVVVADIAERNLRRIDFDVSRVELLTGIGTLDLPSALEFDSRNQLYIVDGAKDRITILGPDMSWKARFSTAEVLDRPVALAIDDSLQRIYISDGEGDRVGVFAVTGEFLFSFGEPGNRDGQFNKPQGLAVDDQNRLFVADMLNARIQVFDAEGRFLYAFGQRGHQPWNFAWPKDLAFDGVGNLYVLDQYKAVITMWRPDGYPILALGELPTRHELGFASPVGIAIDGKDRIYIADRLNRRISIWQALNADYLERHPITAEEERALMRYLEDLAEKRAGRRPR